MHCKRGEMKDGHRFIIFRDRRRSGIRSGQSSESAPHLKRGAIAADSRRRAKFHAQMQGTFDTAFLGVDTWSRIDPLKHESLTLILRPASPPRFSCRLAFLANRPVPGNQNSASFQQVPACRVCKEPLMTVHA
jgi:hypothetical protein